MRQTPVSLLLMILSLMSLPAKAQEQQINAITTAAPFLLIVPDARAGGMGDVGVATSPDANATHHNPSKIVFSDRQFSIGVNFTPWMRQLVNDVYLGGFSVTNVLNERSAWSASFKYFTVGEIQLTDDTGQEIGVEKPHELSFDGTYALKLSEDFSLGVSLRYIRSDFALKISNSNIHTVNTFGVDISGYYNSPEMNFGDFDGVIRGGFNISNIGPKVNYTDGGRESFIPTNMKLGAGFDFLLDEYNTVGITLETNKLLVPTPQPDHSESDMGFMEGIFSSFGDAPGGGKEEWQEFTWAVGTEYDYDNVFAVRAGYFHESEYKGGRQYFTLGLGVAFKATQVDLSYLFNASDINNPLENTLRFSLTFDLGEEYAMY